MWTNKCSALDMFFIEFSVVQTLKSKSNDFMISFKKIFGWKLTSEINDIISYIPDKGLSIWFRNICRLHFVKMEYV